MHACGHGEADTEFGLFASQIRHVLEEVGVGIAIENEAVRADIAADLDDPQGQVRSELVLHVRQDLGMRHRGGDHLEGCRGPGRGGRQQSKGAAQQGATVQGHGDPSCSGVPARPPSSVAQGSGRPARA